MTGKFHTTWGEFGGFKHPNALLYETSYCIAHGGGCSIGDQMHPCGKLDEATYDMIGQAYSEVEKKEEWCTHVTSYADIAFVSLEGANIGGCVAPESQHIFEETLCKSDVGALKVLQEGHFLYDVIDLDDAFERYKVIILPDYIRVTKGLKDKLDNYLDNGGKILATGESGLDSNQSKFMINFGVTYIGKSSFCPSYIAPSFDLISLKRSIFVQYASGQEIENIDAQIIANSVEPYFNRDTFAFSSHQHSPYKLSGDKPGIVKNDNGIYIAWNMFEEYAKVGSFVTKEILIHCINLLLKEKTIEVDLPSQGTVTLMHQENKKRFIHHILYASPIKRGDIKLGTDPRDTISVEVIEDVMTVKEVKTLIRLNLNIKDVYLAPQMEKVPYAYSDGLLSYRIFDVKVHQMVVIEYE